MNTISVCQPQLLLSRSGTNSVLVVRLHKFPIKSKRLWLARLNAYSKSRTNSIGFWWWRITFRTTQSLIFKKYINFKNVSKTASVSIIKWKGWHTPTDAWMLHRGILHLWITSKPTKHACILYYFVLPLVLYPYYRSLTSVTANATGTNFRIFCLHDTREVYIWPRNTTFSGG